MEMPFRTHGDYVEILINGVFYTPRKSKHPETRYVPDRDLIADYLGGLATKEDIIAAAEEYEEEISAREQLAVAKKKVKKLSDKLHDATSVLRKFNNFFNEVRFVLGGRYSLFRAETLLRKYMEKYVRRNS